jgi:D-alanine--poly(phosphoribitol) ligase subunit 2
VKSHAGTSEADIGGERRPAADDAHPPVGRVHRLLVDHLYIDSPTPDTDIIDSGALDSFALVELLVKLEEHFDVEVPVEDLDLDDFRSARRIAHVVASLNGRDPQHR